MVSKLGLLLLDMLIVTLSVVQYPHVCQLGGRWRDGKEIVLETDMVWLALDNSLGLVTLNRLRLLSLIVFWRRFTFLSVFL